MTGRPFGAFAWSEAWTRQAAAVKRKGAALPSVTGFILTLGYYGRWLRSLEVGDRIEVVRVEPAMRLRVRPAPE